MSIARKSADELSLCFSSLFCYVRYWSFVFYNALENKVVDIISLEKKKETYISLPTYRAALQETPDLKTARTEIWGNAHTGGVPDRFINSLT